MASFNILAISLHLLSVLLLSKTQLSLALTTSDIHDLLSQYGLPRGLLPDNVESYTLQSSDGSFEVSLKTPCYVHFDEVVYYDKEIKGKLSYGSVHDVSGIQAKKLFVWLPVTGIEVSKADAGMVKFFVGPVSEELPAQQFEDVPACKRKVGGLRTDLESMVDGSEILIFHMKDVIWTIHPGLSLKHLPFLVARVFGESERNGIEESIPSTIEQRWEQTKSSHVLPAHFEVLQLNLYL
ncbi:unnamed protein product [Dovyalis caffra]|uniref:Uncharacterized protein n=1 Tax=Dovyalis caffra TaxID=77055 RepID=A0AAV1RTI8_9ROSI|nr:unnamed protein product [Dovyalis caffra]